MDGIMKTWNEPDIFESNQPNSLQRFNELWRLRREQYDYDETKLIDVKPIVDKLNDTGIVVLKDVVDKKLLQKVRDDAEEIWNEGIKVKGAYSATAGAYPCRAWGNIDGDAGTLAFRGEQGCSSITDSGTGQYTCTLDSSSPDTNGSVTTSVRVNSTAAQQWYLVYGMWTDINQIEIGARLIDNNDDSFAIADVDLCLFSAFR